MTRSKTPRVLLLSVSPLPLSLATTRRISFDFFSSGYLDVSVPRVPYVNLWIQLTFHDSSSWGFPHSEICGSKLICSSPQLIAACHVLLRLPVPRHSPYALVRLNFPSVQFSHSELLEFHKQIFWLSILLWKGFILLLSESIFPPFVWKCFHLRWNCIFYPNWKDLLISR